MSGAAITYPIAVGPKGDKGDTGASGVGTVTEYAITLIGGAKTFATGDDLSGAKFTGAPRLSALNASPALGAQIECVTSTNSIVLTAYDATGAAATGDVATYTVAMVGVA